MKKLALLSTLALVLVSPFAGADEAVRAAQAALQRAGYYNGAADGELNAETRAALRRFQIRNQLQASGDLTPETAAALNREPAAQAAQAPAEPAAPAPSIAPAAPPITEPAPAVRPPEPAVDPRYAALFARTPFDHAAPETQAETVRKAQGLLAERRFYRGPVDGIPGPAFEEALLRLQSSMGLPRTGRLDIDTLAALRLLPIAKLKRPRVEPEPYIPRVPSAPPGAVRGVPQD